MHCARHADWIFINKKGFWPFKTTKEVKLLQRLQRYEKYKWHAALTVIVLDEEVERWAVRKTDLGINLSLGYTSLYSDASQRDISDLLESPSLVSAI